MDYTPLQRRIARENNTTFEEVIRHMYIEQNMTMQEMAKALDVNIRTIQRWIKDCGIKARKMTWI